MNQILTAVLIFISFLHAQRISVIPEEIQMETTWYVSPTGSDESGDGSEGNPFGTIQHGIDFSQSGDEVIVLPGTYFEGINFYGKEITVGSLFHITGDTTYIQETIIDGNNESCPVVFVNGESRNSKLTGLTIQNGDGCTFGNGGGIYLEDSSPTLDHLVIQENFGLTGGGVFVNVGGNPLLKNSVIRNNTCFSEGCGVAVYNAEIEIENCTVTSNMFTIDYSLGGGVSFYNSEGSVINTVITQNSAESGGGISCYNSNPTIEGTIISNNVAIYGGGINCRENSSPALLNVSILENTATQGGGLRCRDNSNPAVQNSTILGNSAAQYGGGIYTNNADPNINHSLIVQNSAGEGGGVYGRINSDITLQNVTISDNSATEGGGLYLRNNSSSLMEHSIFWNDTPQEIFLHPSETANQITVSNSDVQGGEDGIVTNDNGTIYWYDGNIDSDPLFCDPENGDYTVAANSPCQLWDANIGALGIGCDAVWSFTLDYLEIQDENNNEMWEPGETLTLSVTLCNVGTADHFFYPGVVLSEINPNPQITITNPEFWWYGLYAGQCEEAIFVVSASEDISQPTQVDFLVEAYALNCENQPEFCIHDVSFEFSIMVETDVGETSIDIQYDSDWNLVGLPLTVEDPNYQNIFMNPIEGTLYRFDNGYISETELTPGNGYWIRLESEETVNFTGISISEITIPLNEGWNLISGISDSIPAEIILDSDGIIIEGTIYQFDGGYSPAEVIEPGRGYWLRTSESGEVSIINFN